MLHFLRLTVSPQTGMSFKDVRFMTPLPPDELSKGEEQTMKDWLENYRPVRQRTVRSETTKDKAGTLPPAVYSNANPNSTARVFFLADQVEQTPTDATVPLTNPFKQVEEYKCDSDASDNDVDIESEELVTGKPIMTTSGRQVKSGQSLIFRRAQNGKPGRTNLLIKAL